MGGGMHGWMDGCGIAGWMDEWMEALMDRQMYTEVAG